MFSKNCPFFLHTITGRGTPSAVQLNDAFFPFSSDECHPLLFNKTALTKNNYQVNILYNIHIQV